MLKKALNFALATVALLSFVSIARADVVPLELHVRCTEGGSTRIQFLSEHDILSMPQYSIATSTPWKTKSQYSGVRLADVIKKTCPHGTLVTITAYDEYEIKDIDVSGIIKDQPILAYSMDGQRLLLRNFGPLFLVYEQGESYDSRMKTSQYSAKEIRQIKIISIR
ncbi:molybdopterin-dependent oxidoreductase [Burkholderia stabilis]|uniref:molybdopterin-dependent oxidoreductase n=1 Tax=Burkholderia stabilis TaxID=95485 RepID=UPI001F4A1B0E|nr:molybdopterin-dependent oxidoreductase [Burkholderia stabilis]